MSDTNLSASYSWYNSNTSIWRFSFSLSLPTGSIDEEGDTPCVQGEMQLPYTMQLGSGTYDFPFELKYQNSEVYDLNLSLTANLRTGTCSRQYRFGNNYSINSRYKIAFQLHFKRLLG